MLEPAVEHVRDDLHVAMRMRPKPATRRDAVFVDHSQPAKAHVFGVVVLGERKSVVTVEPAVVGVAALLGLADGQHAEGMITNFGSHKSLKSLKSRNFVDSK